MKNALSLSPVVPEATICSGMGTARACLGEENNKTHPWLLPEFPGAELPFHPSGKLTGAWRQGREGREAG